MKNGSLTDWKCMLKGFVSGSFFGAGIMSGYGVVLQSLFFFIGVAVFVESVCVPGKDVHIGTVIFFNVVGISMSFLALPVMKIYVLAVFLIMVLMYGYVTFE